MSRRECSHLPAYPTERVCLLCRAEGILEDLGYTPPEERAKRLALHLARLVQAEHDATKKEMIRRLEGRK